MVCGDNVSMKRVEGMNHSLAKFLLRAVLLLLLPAMLHAAPPNIVFILADDLGYGDVSCYGAPDIKTPNMDKLATQGVRCTDGYAAFPVCSPSRTAILTGRYPHRFGLTFEDYFGEGAIDLDPQKHPTIGQMLKQAGYTTGCFGKWNVANTHRRPANDYGFDKWVGIHINHDYYTHKHVANGELDLFEDGKPLLDRNGTWSDTIFADEAIRFIKGPKTKPFFIYLTFQAPHDPIQDPDIPFDPPRDKKKAENRPTYIKMVERLDREIGRVLQALQEQGLAEKTLVILTSDNGAEPVIGRNLPLRGAKQELLEGGIRVPLILRWPGVLAAGKVFSRPVIAMDLTATMAAAGGAQLPPNAPFDGVDLMPALTGNAQLSPGRSDYWRRRMVNVSKNEYFIRQSAVRKGDWKYLRTYERLDTGKFSEKYDEALYNLKNDIGEERNLARLEAAKLKEFRSLFSTWEEEINSSLKSGDSGETNKILSR